MKEALNIKIVEGNAFTLVWPLCIRSYENMQPTDKVIDARELENVQIAVNGQPYDNYTLEEEGVYLYFGADLDKRSYNLEISAEYKLAKVRAAEYRAFTIVDWSFQADAENYLQGSNLVVNLRSIYILNGGSIKDDILLAIELLKEALQGPDSDATLTAILEALAPKSTSQEVEEAKQAIIAALPEMPTDYAKSEELVQAVRTILGAIPTDYAKEANATLNKQAILNAIAALVIPTVEQIQEGLAKSSELPTDYAKAETLAQASELILAAIANSDDKADAIYNNLLTALMLIRVGLQGGDSTATLAEIKSLIENTPAIFQDYAREATVILSTERVLQELGYKPSKSELASALAEVVASVVAAIPSIPTDYAKELAATANKQAVLDAIAALVIPTVEQIQNGIAKTSQLPTDYATAQALADALASVITALAAKANKTDIDNAVAGLPKVELKTIDEYEALQAYDAKTLYFITDNNRTKVITRYIGETPIPLQQGTVLGSSAFGNSVLL